MILKFIVIAICVNFAITDEDRRLMEKVNEQFEKCVKSLDLIDDEVRAYLKKRPLVIGEGNLRCYFQCMPQGLGQTNEDGNLVDKFDADNIPAHYIAIAEDCRINFTGNDNCEKAFNFQKCLIDKKEGN